MIQLNCVKKTFNQGKGNEFQAIKGIDLAIEQGKVTVFKGPSGSGKTTLLTLLGALARPTSGRVRLGDRDISALPERFLTHLRRNTFGFVFQRFNLIDGISVLENVMLPALPTGRRYREIEARSHRLLERLGLDHKADSKAEWLSGGEAQRAAIARALINEPEVIIADEPTANLDSRLSGEFLGIVDGLKREGRTVLMASHDPLIHGARVADTVITLQDGLLAPDAA